MNHFCLRILLLAIVGLVSKTGLANSLACRAFLIHPFAQVPRFDYQPPEYLPADWEKSMLAGLDDLPHNENFSSHYGHWLNRQGQRKSETMRHEFLKCLYFYLSRDSSGDGFPDWTAIVDNRLSETVVPFSNDIDGDGIENVLDPSPFLPQPGLAPSMAGVLPEHLTRPPNNLSLSIEQVAAVQKLQNQLYKETGLIAVHSSDFHSLDVLSNLLYLFTEVLPNPIRERLSDLRYIYAFSSYQRFGSVGAYHHQLQALSIGGSKVFSIQDRGPAQDMRILATLAHEIGHALVFSTMDTNELEKLAVQLGQWQPSEQVVTKDSFFAPLFFRSHPVFQFSRSLLFANNRQHLKEPKLREFPSHYSLVNIHEWFAEVFSAYVLQQLGRRGKLGEDWESLLVQTPRWRGDYWYNYHSLPAEFSPWLHAHLSEDYQPLLREGE